MKANNGPRLSGSARCKRPPENQESDTPVIHGLPKHFDFLRDKSSDGHREDDPTDRFADPAKDFADPELSFLAQEALKAAELLPDQPLDDFLKRFAVPGHGRD